MANDVQSVYGWSPRTPVVLDDPYTDNRPGGQTVGGVGINALSLGHQNPLFWLLVISLIVLGYIGFMFDFRVGKK